MCKKEIEKNKTVLDFFVDCFVKAFRHDSFVKRFCGVFELPSLRNTRKRYKQIKNKEKLTSKFLSIYLGKFFDMDFFSFFFVKIFVWCFTTPLTEKRPKTYLKKSRGGGGGVGWWLGGSGI
jgi:hypothetical protein